MSVFIRYYTRACIVDKACIIAIISPSASLLRRLQLWSHLPLPLLDMWGLEALGATVSRLSPVAERYIHHLAAQAQSR